MRIRPPPLEPADSVSARRRLRIPSKGTSTMVGLLVALVAFVTLTRLLSLVQTSTLAEAFWQVYVRVAPGQSVRALREKRHQLIEIRAQRAATSSQDEFAKWARLDRQHQSVKRELDVLTAAVGVSRQRVTTTVSFGKWLLTTGTKLGLQWYYRRVPVVWLPPSVLPVPVEWILSLPVAPRGSISVGSWLVISDAAVTSLVRMFRKYWLARKQVDAYER